MPKQDTSKRIRPEYIEQGTEVLDGLRTLPDYQPQRQEAAIVAIEANQQEMQAAQATELALKEQYEAAVAAARAAEWKFHNSVLQAKAAVIAQYGDDNHLVRVIGRKRVSDYSRPVRKKAS